MFAMIVLAGGIGSRMGSNRNKVYLSVAGREILAYSLATAAQSGADRIVVVARVDDRDVAARLLDEHAPDIPAQIVSGGSTRHLSEWAGLGALADDIDTGTVTTVAVHDGARPFASTELTAALRQASSGCDGAIPGVPFDDTVYRPSDRTFVDTDRLVRVQTPQVFTAATVLTAHRRAAEAGFEGVDTAQVLETFMAETRVAVVPGEATNIKVTYTTDMERAETIAIGGSVETDPRADVLVGAGDIEPSGGEFVTFGGPTGNELREGVDARFSLVPAVDAVKDVDDGVVVSTIDRTQLRLVRPPEVVRRSTLLAALRDSTGPVNPSRAIAAAGGVCEAVVHD